MADWIIETLTKDHNRTDFCSSSSELNEYLQRYALQNLKRRLNRCYVLTHTSNKAVCGYYTLSPYCLPTEKLRPFLSANKLGPFPVVPVHLLGKLALDKRLVGRGMGTFLLSDALLRARESDLPGIGVYVEAKDQNALEFYLKHSFVQLSRLNGFFSFVSNHG